MKRLLIIVLFGLLAGQASQAETANTPADSPLVDLMLGELSVAREDWQGAAEYFDRVLQVEETPFLLERRIGLDAAQQNLQNALPYAKRLVSQDPTNIIAWNTLGVIYLENNEIDQAADAFLEVVKLIKREGEDGYISVLRTLQLYDALSQAKVLINMSDKDPEASSPLLYAAGILIDLKDFNRAKPLLLQAYLIDDKSLMLNSLIAYMYWYSGELEMAVDSLKKAYERINTPEIAKEYIAILMNDFHYLEALEVGEKVLAEHEAIPAQLYGTLAVLYYSLNDLPNAKLMLDKIADNQFYYVQTAFSLFDMAEKNRNYDGLFTLLRNDEAMPKEYYMRYEVARAAAALKVNNYLEFLTIYDALRVYAPEQVAFLYMMELGELESFNEYDRVEALLTLLGDNPLLDESLVTYLKAMVEYNRGNVAKMEAILKARVTDDPNDAINLNALGYSLLETGDQDRFDEAFKYILEANGVMPQQDFIEDSIGWAFYLKGDYEKAQRYLARAFSQNNYPEIIGHYILVLDKLGETERVARLLATFKAVYGDTPEYQTLVETLKMKE